MNLKKYNLVIINSSEFCEVNGKKYFRSGIETQIDNLSKNFKKTFIYSPKTKTKFTGHEFDSSYVEILPFTENLHENYSQLFNSISKYNLKIGQIIQTHKEDSIFLIYFPDSFLGILAVRLLKKQKDVKYFVRITANITKEFRNRNNMLIRKVLYYLINPIIYLYLKLLLRNVLCFYSGYQIYHKNPPSYRVFSASMSKNQFQFRDILFENKKEYTLLYVGRFDKKKGLRYLIESTKFLKSNCKLKIVGFGDKEDEVEIKNLIKEYSKLSKIEYVGYVPFGEKLYEIYKQSDILVFPSLEDQQGKSYIEAMGFDLMVVASDIDGLNLILKNNENAILFEPANSKDIAEKINLLIENPILQKKLIINARKTVKNLTIENLNKIIISNLKNYYK